MARKPRGRRRRARGEGTVYEVRPGLFCAEATLGKRPNGKPYRPKFYGHSEAEAWQKLQQARRLAEENRLPLPNRLTVAEWAQQWLRDVQHLRGKRRTGLAENTVEVYRNALRYLTDAYGPLRLRDLTGRHLTDLYVRMRESGRSLRQCEIVHKVASQMLRAALRERILPRDVSEDVANPPHPEADDPRALTPEQVAALLKAAEGTRWAVAWRLALDACMSRGELLGLQWRDVDLDAGTVRIERQALRTSAAGTTPGDLKARSRRRVVKLGAGTVEALRQWRAEWARRTGRMPAGAAYVFPAQAGPGRTAKLDPDRPSSPESLDAAFRRAADAAGLREFVLHDLRHTGLSWLADAGINPKAAARRAGHDVRTMLVWYVRAMERSEGRAATVVDERLQEAARQDITPHASAEDADADAAR